MTKFKEAQLKPKDLKRLIYKTNTHSQNALFKKYDITLVNGEKKSKKKPSNIPVALLAEIKPTTAYFHSLLTQISIDLHSSKLSERIDAAYLLTTLKKKHLTQFLPQFPQILQWMLVARANSDSFLEQKLAHTAYAQYGPLYLKLPQHLDLVLEHVALFLFKAPVLENLDNFKLLSQLKKKCRTGPQKYKMAHIERTFISSVAAIATTPSEQNPHAIDAMKQLKAYAAIDPAQTKLVRDALKRDLTLRATMGREGLIPQRAKRSQVVPI